MANFQLEEKLLMVWAPDMATKQKRGKRGKSKHASALDVCFERMRALVDNADIPICNRIRFLIRDVIVSCPRYRSCILFFYVTNCPVSLLNRFVGKTLRKCAQINGLQCVLPQKKSKRRARPTPSLMSPHHRLRWHLL